MRKKAASLNDSVPRKKNDLYLKRQMQITKKAMKLFIKKGYAQTSMREISNATGIDISNLYYFIKSKDEILFRVFDRIHKQEMEPFEKQEIRSIDDPVEQLRTIIQKLLDHAYDYKDEILLIYREAKSLPKSALKNILGRESHYINLIEEILKKGKARNYFHFEDASFVANKIVFEFALYPLRSWNLKKYSKEELASLLETDIMKTIM